MSVRSKEVKAIVVSPGIVVHSSRRRRHRSHLKLREGVLLCFVVLIAIGISIYRLHTPHSNEASTTTVDVTDSGALTAQTVDKNQSVAHQALGLALNGQQTAAQQLLSAQIAQTNSMIQKGALYEQKANLANDAGNYTLGLQYARQAEDLNPTVNSANLIALSAQLLGNKALAIKYYELELQRLTPSPVPGEQDQVESSIKALGDS